MAPFPAAMTQEQPRPRDLPSTVLLILGLVDLVRGTLHTFFVHWAAATFAHLDLSASAQDQLTLLGAFGISNLLTGSLFIFISYRARALARTVLLLIPCAYAVGKLGLMFAGVKPHAAFLGKYFLLLYLAVCLGTVLLSSLPRSRSPLSGRKQTVEDEAGPGPENESAVQSRFN